MKRPQMSLGFKLTLVFMIVMLGATSIPTAYELTYLFNQIYDESRRKMDSDIEIAALVLEKHETMLLRIGRTFSRDMWLGKIVAYPSDPRTKVTMLKERAKNFLRGFSEPDLSFMTITDASGAVVFRSRRELTGLEDISTKDPLFKGAIKGDQVTGYRAVRSREMWEHGLLKDEPPATDKRTWLLIEAAVPIFSQEAEVITPSGKSSEQPGAVGTIIVGYWVNRDKTVLEEIHKRTKGAASIYLKEGLVNTTARNWISRLPDEFFTPGRRFTRKIVTYADRGEIGGYFPLQDIGGGPAAIFELRSSTASISQIWSHSLRNSFIFTAFGLLVAMSLGMVVMRRLTGSIQLLSSGAEEIGRGNLTHRITIGGRDEISQLADGFNLMAVRLQRSMEEMRLSKSQVEEYSNRLKSAHASLEMYSHELEKVNQQLLDSNIKLQKANEVKDTFLSTVSHELKTPLTTIIGYVSMFIEGALGGMSDEQRQALEVVSRRGKNLQDLISDLLDLSKIDSGKVELRRRYLDINNELKNVEEVFHERLKANNQQMMISVPENPPRVSADSERIAQVLFNLVGNAIKFTPAGGMITVRISCPQDANHLIISVADTGIGIPQSELTHIFERFYQVDRRDGREYPGTGLGLAISKDLVELHGGRIWAESRDGHGSTISFTLPL